MNHPTIVDLTTPAPTAKILKPIELVACFQDYIYEDDAHKYQFESSDFSHFLRGCNSIKRLATLEAKYPTLKEFDLIEVDEMIFLGRWNDGIVV